MRPVAAYEKATSCGVRTASNARTGKALAEGAEGSIPEALQAFERAAALEPENSSAGRSRPQRFNYHEGNLGNCYGSAFWFF